MPIALVSFEAHPNTQAGGTKTGVVGAASVTLLSFLTGSALHSDTRFVEITVEDADIRFTDDGTVPVAATLGKKVTNGSRKLLSRTQAENCRLIRVASDARIQISQFIS